MKRHQQNPFDSIPFTQKLKHTLLEFPLNLKRFPVILRQTKEIGYSEADSWLSVAQKAIANGQNSIFKQEESPVLDGFVGVGYTFTVFRFRLNEKLWTLKISGLKAHPAGYLDPSTPQYADWYSQGLAVLQEISSARLPNLIPQPQEVLFASNGTESRALIIEPYYEEILPLNAIYHFPLDQQKSLAEEMRLFTLISRELDINYGYIVDLDRPNNIAIARQDNQVSLIMIDNKMEDKKAPSPLVHIHNILRRAQRIRYMNKIADKIQKQS